GLTHRVSAARAIVLLNPEWEPCPGPSASWLASIWQRAQEAPPMHDRKPLSHFPRLNWDKTRRNRPSVLIEPLLSPRPFQSEAMA
ncbi:MAG: hypothetical protein O7G30_10435, partial [Proteobacteria bacterium]|nr:hypothetical protein [Pseudomonadota bacterium]